MSYKKVSDSDKAKLEQFARTNFYSFFAEFFIKRKTELDISLRLASPENFQQVQGRALELDDLLTLLKIKVGD